MLATIMLQQLLDYAVDLLTYVVDLVVHYHTLILGHILQLMQ